MNPLKINLSLDVTSFPEIGVPFAPLDAKKVKESCPNLKGNLKKEYDSFVQSANDTRSSFNYISGGSITNDSVTFDFDYEDGIPQTYKFLGMDIDTEFRSVIPFGDGCIVVEDMFDKDEILNITSGLNRFATEDLKSARNYIKNCSDSVPRKLATAMKSGILYDLYKEVSSATGYDANSLNVTNIKKIVDIVDNCMGNLDEDGTPLEYNSVLLNLVHESNKNKEEILKSKNTTDTSVSGIVVFLIFSYWSSIIKTYNNIYTAIACVDLWQRVYKKLIGDDEFNKRLKGCCNIKDMSNGNLVTDRIVSFSGVARNGDTHDANVIRYSAGSALDNIKGLFNGDSYKTDVEVLNDILLSGIQNENFDNPFDLTIEEIQAMSSYDCLQRIDTDASLCMESYNMDDPEERAMFLSSAIKSYERNFKEYKPKNDYEVTEAMANMIERGDRFRDRIISDDSYTEEDNSMYVVTSTDDEISLNVNKRILLKVSKLVDIQLDKVAKLF